MKPRYPIYVISKGRSETCKTARRFLKDGVSFHLVIEPHEFDLYLKNFPKEIIFTLPFQELGLGSIPVRNWVKDHATKLGEKRHWIIDDNISGMYRRYKGKRININFNIGLAITEKFIDRYENVAVAGLNYDMFVPDNTPLPPFYLNVHVYSCLLILNKIPNKWRGRYNEDTDLCLQVLADGWCTVLMNIFSVKKTWTMTMKGGNTDDLYKDDGRLKMSRSLEKAWPGVVKTVRRFQRPQHFIRDQWDKFDTPLIKKKGIKIKSGINEFGMKLKRVGPEIKSKRIQKIYDESPLREGKNAK